MTRSKRACIPDLDKLRSRFEQWRQTRQGKARIPNELWAAPPRWPGGTASTAQPPHYTSTAAS